MAETNRRILWIGLVLVVFGGALLWLQGRAGSPPVAAKQAQDAAAAGQAGASASHVIHDDGASPIADVESPPIVVTRSGAIIKDRTTNGVRDVPDPIPPGSEFNLKGVTTATGTALGTAMLPVVAECAKGVPSEARGKRPMVQPAFVVQVAGGQLTVTDVAFSTRDIDPSARASFTSCIRDKAIGTNIAAPGEGDLDRYHIHIPMKLPAL